jgi:MFS family permease
LSDTDHSTVTAAPQLTSSGRTDWGRYGRRPLTILALIALVDAVDRGILPGVLTQVQDDLGFSDTEAGWLGSIFILTGFLVTLPAGYLADRYRRTRIIAIVLASWGVISAVNAAVRNLGQFLAVRAALGVGETIDNPASQSLVADYYRPAVRGRAYSLLRVAPLLGAALGQIIAAIVATQLGWRWAFLVVGVPGSLLAIAVWRLPEPARGGSDGPGLGDQPEAPLPAAAPIVPNRQAGLGALWADVRVALRVRSLRSLMLGSAIAGGALSGLGFWAPAFYERHTDLSAAAAATLAGVLILGGAIGGTIALGRMVDTIRDRYEGAPMLIAGVTQLIGASLLMVSFLDVPLWVRLPLQCVAVAFIVGGLVAIPVMITEVVPAGIRGIAFSVTGFLGAVASAISPTLIGFIADQHDFVVDGEVRGNLARAFLTVTPLVMLGALVLLRGRRHVAGDIAAVAAERAQATTPG